MNAREKPNPKASLGKDQFLSIRRGVDLYRHAESPELEIICGGINAKTAKAAGLWRQGNLLHFGFEQSPAELNETGRALLVNSVAYIARFREDRPITDVVSPFVGPASHDRAAIFRALTRADLGLEYVILKGPFPVTLEFEEADVPESYRQWPGGAVLGKRIKVWKVQGKEFPEIDPGLVSDPYGFDDSPDAEAISSGINSKGPEAVALGRHGSFFLWGVSAQPSDMTESGRNCFLNSICYIKKFDGQPPLVRKTSQGRRWALVYAGIELLERCITMLEKDDQAELAGRILKRYTTEKFSRPDQWRAWQEENHDRLFFTDTGGYKFMVNRPADELAGKSTTQKGVR